MLVDYIVKMRPDCDIIKELGTDTLWESYIADDEICDTSIVLVPPTSQITVALADDG